MNGSPLCPGAVPSKRHVAAALYAAVGCTRHLDFKRDMPAAWDDRSKLRFMAHVTAFANAGSGDILFGMEENADARAVEIGQAAAHLSGTQNPPMVLHPIAFRATSRAGVAKSACDQAWVDSADGRVRS